MKKLAIATLIAILALAVMPAWAEEGWKTLNSTEHRFSLDYPDDWDYEVSIDALLTLMKTDGGLPMVITVAAEKDTSNAENGILPKYLKTEMDAVEREIAALGMGDAVTLERGESQVNGLPAYVLDLKLDLMGMAQIRMYNVIVDMGSSLAYLSFSGENGSYMKNAETFTKIKNSLRPIGEASELQPAPESREKEY